ncbi:MAG TPA: diaminopropionate ammonia-lyase [Xanthobacteraceae bacterium]|nr:diaminopropionate ammonia-lyase [Xanthobacteraceae bacterium]
MLTSTRFRVFANPRAARDAPYAADDRAAILSLARLACAKREIMAWPGYKPTPLHLLPKLAARAGISAIFYKDEAERFGLGSFKALGGAYAVFKLLRNSIREQKNVTASSFDLTSGRYADVTSRITVTCATDGNHGRSVAWGAHTFGCRCVIYIPETVSAGRCQAIAAYGAEIRRFAGTYDDGVRRAAADAAAQGWMVVSDTAYEGYTDVPRDVMQGYGLMVEEAVRQTSALPSHVFVQGGVGGLAGSVCSYLWERYGAARPYFVIVEPEKADCFYRSGVAGRATPAEGALDTIMAGLACGEVSPLAWRILATGADAFMTIDDQAAVDCMRLLAEGRFGDDPVVAGESGVAGLAGLLMASADAEARARLDLRRDSRVLVFGTEGATDPDVYRSIVGRRPDDVVAQRSTR